MCGIRRGELLREKMELTYELMAFMVMVVFLVVGLMDPVSFVMAIIFLGLGLYFRQQEKAKKKKGRK